MYRLCAAAAVVGVGAAVLLLVRPDRTSPKAVADRAVRALGGEGVLARYHAVAWRARGVFHGPPEMPFVGEFALEGPAKFRLNARMDGGGTPLDFLLVLNGDRGWGRLNGDTDELDRDRIAEEREKAHVYRLTLLAPLHEPGIELSPLAETSVEGRAEVGLKVAAAGHRDVCLFFDRDSGLLLRSETRVKDPEKGAEVTEEVFYGDYREADGLRYAGKLTVRRDGKPYADIEVIQLKPREYLDNDLFARP